MKLRGAIAVALVAIPMVAVAPAHAASTRAEYVAQVDPICQSYLGPEGDAGSRFNKNVKRLVRVAKSENVKAIKRQTRRTAGSLDRFAHIDNNLSDQIAAVPPPDADAGRVATWLKDRRRVAALVTSAASALRQFKYRVFQKRLGAAKAANTKARGAIAGFGFQVCG